MCPGIRFIADACQLCNMTAWACDICWLRSQGQNGLFCKKQIKNKKYKILINPISQGYLYNYLKFLMNEKPQSCV